MTVRRMELQAPCPSCGERKMTYTAADLDIPYFGGVTQLMFDCAVCGFRHSDFLIASHLKPTRYTLRVTQEDQMMVRVVRSTSGTVRIPELGVLIEPGPASDAYVSNIEGVLVRVEAVLEQLHRDADDETTRKECEARLGDLRNAKVGRFPFTFILEDPYGNSMVADPASQVEEISPGQAAELQTGEYTIRLQDAKTDLTGNGHRGPDSVKPS